MLGQVRANECPTGLEPPAGARKKVFSNQLFSYFQTLQDQFYISKTMTSFLPLISKILDKRLRGFEINKLSNNPYLDFNNKRGMSAQQRISSELPDEVELCYFGRIFVPRRFGGVLAFFKFSQQLFSYFYPLWEALTLRGNH